MKLLELRIVTPERTMVVPEVKSLIVDCPDGKRGILPGHAPFLFEVAIGVLQCTLQNGETRYFALGGGMAEVLPQSVVIVTNSAEESYEIDVHRAKEALQRAEKRLKEERLPEIDVVRAQASLMRALARLRVSELVKREKQR